MTADAFDLGAVDLLGTTFVRHVEFHDTLGSTNDRAAELARESELDLPALVVARRQTAGRGRGENKWWSADGALTLSLLLDPAVSQIKAANWPQLSLATAVGVCDGLRNELGGDLPLARVGIKWPNDVMLGGRKVCGILIESPGGTAPAKDRLIVGIGINVNNSTATAPREALARATALCDASGRRHDLPKLLISVLKGIAVRWRQLSAGDPVLIADWQGLDSLAGLEVAVEAHGRRIEGRCVTIGADGALTLQTAAGTQQIFSGSVHIL